MTDYQSVTTDALIDLLFTEEDRVPAGLIDLIARRGSEALPRLLDILRCDDYWYEGQHGDFWIELHVVTILSRQGDPAVLPHLVPRILTSCFADYQWLFERWPDVFAGFGMAAVAPLMAMVEEYRDAFRDGSDFSAARVEAMRSLSFIANDHPAACPQIVSWLADLLTDPGEADRDLLSAVVTPLLLLDRRNGQNSPVSLGAVKAAYRRGVIDTSLTGSLAELLRSIGPATSKRFFRPLLHLFHSPEQIAFRAQIWASPDPHRRVDELRDAGSVLIGPPPFPPPLSNSYPDSALSPDYAGSVVSPPLISRQKVGRNATCPCGSGKKFKKCCESASAAD